jgi:hypothetical protein
MYRLRRSIRRTLWIFGAVVIMAATTLIGALVATIPHFLSGAEIATTAASTLLSNPKQAATQFTTASQDFDASLAGLRSLPEPAQFPSLVPPFSWYIHLNKAAVYLSRAGGDASTLASSYPATQTSNDPSSLLTAHSAALGQLIENQRPVLDNLAENLGHADEELSKVPSWILFSKRGELANLKSRVHQLSIALPKAVQFVTALRQALGESDSDIHTALIIFQNDSELRPSGGFIGSYGVLTGSSGNIRSFKMGTDIYTLDKQLSEQIEPPPQLETITPTWAFRDSNVGAGFLPDIASQVSDFYTKETDITPDFIVFTDLSMLEDLLTITGPVTLPGTTTELNHDSVGTALTAYVENDYWDSAANKIAKAPKSVIADLIPILLSKLKTTPNALGKVPSFVSQATTRKSLQFWSNNPDLETATTAIFPLDIPPSGDWMKIVNTNIGGKKSSSNISQSVVITEKSANGGKDRTVTIHRTHHGTGVWPDDENRNYMEVYLPPEAEIAQPPDGKGGENLLPEDIQASYGLLGVTWPGEVKRTDTWVRVGFWATTSVAEQTEFILKYHVPSSIANQPFTYLKQAGAREDNLKAFSYDGNVTSNLTLEKRGFLW